MSKIGQVNFDLQEQAEALGFESVQEALDNGCKAFINVDGTTMLLNMKPDKEAIERTTDSLKELAKAHEDYEHRKKIIIDKLEMLISDTPYQVYKDTLREAIEFIKEKEV